MPTDISERPVETAIIIAHVNLLQGIITRLANNSASCKTWCLTLVAAILGLAGATRSAAIVPIALVPVIIFGLLDAMYLAEERAYRGLYGAIVSKLRTGRYTMADVFEARAEWTGRHFYGALASWSCYPVYGGLILAYVVAAASGGLQMLFAQHP
jgi:hypothetical protein